MGSVISLPWKKGFYSIDQVLPQEGSTALETSARWLNPDYVSSAQVRTSSDQSYHSYSDTAGTTQASSASSLGKDDSNSKTIQKTTKPNTVKRKKKGMHSDQKSKSDSAVYVAENKNSQPVPDLRHTVSNTSISSQDSGIRYKASDDEEEDLEENNSNGISTPNFSNKNNKRSYDKSENNDDNSSYSNASDGPRYDQNQPISQNEVGADNLVSPSLVHISENSFDDEDDNMENSSDIVSSDNKIDAAIISSNNSSIQSSQGSVLY